MSFASGEVCYSMFLISASCYQFQSWTQWPALVAVPRIGAPPGQQLCFAVDFLTSKMVNSLAGWATRHQPRFFQIARHKNKISQMSTIFFLIWWLSLLLCLLLTTWIFSAKKLRLLLCYAFQKQGVSNKMTNFDHQNQRFPLVWKHPVSHHSK